MKHNPISNNSDFARAYKRGKNYVHPHFVLYVNKNRVGFTRLGITASKKVGNAVQRNRARRVLRAAVCAVLPAHVGSFDIVLVARALTKTLKSTELEQSLRGMLKKAGIQQNTAGQNRVNIQ